MTMHKLYWRISATAMLAGGLGACGSSNNPSPVVPPPPVAAAKFEDQFGANFGTAYRTDPNTDPAKDPVAGDIVPLSLSTEPVAS